MIQFSLGKQPYNPVFPIESGQSCNLAFSQSSDPFRDQDSGHASDLFQRDLPKYGEFRSQLLEQISVFPLYPGAGGRESYRSADDLRQRNQAFEARGVLLLIPLRPVGELLHPMGYPDRQLPPADRADPPVLFRFRRRQAETAFPMPVIMILALLREKLNGAFQSFSGLDRIL